MADDLHFGNLGEISDPGADPAGIHGRFGRNVACAEAVGDLSLAALFENQFRQLDHEYSPITRNRRSMSSRLCSSLKASRTRSVTAG
jgi:hypothetical protein